MRIEKARDFNLRNLEGNFDILLHARQNMLSNVLRLKESLYRSSVVMQEV